MFRVFEHPAVYLGIGDEEYRRVLARALWELDSVKATSDAATLPPGEVVYVLDIFHLNQFATYLNPQQVILLASRDSFNMARLAGITRVVDPSAPLNTVVLAIVAAGQALWNA